MVAPALLFRQLGRTASPALRVIVEPPPKYPLVGWSVAVIAQPGNCLFGLEASVAQHGLVLCHKQCVGSIYLVASVAIVPDTGSVHCIQVRERPQLCQVLGNEQGISYGDGATLLGIASQIRPVHGRRLGQNVPVEVSDSEEVQAQTARKKRVPHKPDAYLN